MLSLTQISGPRSLAGFGGYGPVEYHTVLGVPFKWQLVSGFVGEAPFYVVKEDSDKTVDVPKTRVPKPLAKVMDALLAKAIGAVLEARPSLATDPKELLAQAKKHPIYSKSIMGAQPYSGALIGKVDKINGKRVLLGKAYSVYATDLGSSYRLRLYAPKSGVIPGIDKLTAILTYPAKLATEAGFETVDALKESVEAVLKLLMELFKKLCQIAQSDITKFAQSIGTKYSGNQNLALDLTTSFSTGDKAKMTKTIVAAYAGGVTAKIAVVNAVLTQVQGLCGGPSKSKDEAKKPKSRWPIVVGVIGGAAILGGAGWLAFGGKRRRRR